MFWCLGPEASGVFAAQQNGTCCPAMEGKVLTAGLNREVPQQKLLNIYCILENVLEPWDVSVNNTDKQFQAFETIL